MTQALMIAAPASGHGKTVITAALLRLLKRRGVAVRAAKVGPDYIDPAFHAAACGGPCLTIDAWAMSAAQQAAQLKAAAADGELLVIEAVMGLFDGVAAGAADTAGADGTAGPTGAEKAEGPGLACVPGFSPQEVRAAARGGAALRGNGSSAEVAARFSIPVLLVLDCARQGASAAAVVHGFASLRPEVRVAGVVLNRVGSARHAEMVRAAVETVSGVPVIGAVPRDERLRLPERHLGLVPAGEHAALEAWLEAAADALEEHLALCRLGVLTADLAAGSENSADAHPAPPPLGQRIAIARDAAFCFAYAHWLAHWRARGAELSFFSPLDDEGPEMTADAVFLPGGYPELHAARLAHARRFRERLRAAARRGALIYGECGGFMALGRGLIDAEGAAHAMCDLLPLATSFAEKRLHLGYRRLAHESPLPFPARLRGHEFHYARIVWQGAAEPLFRARNAAGEPLAAMGLRVGTVMGSFAHVICPEDSDAAAGDAS